MDANDEGSKPEPGPGAPEGAVPGVARSDGARSDGAASEDAAPDTVTGARTSPDEPATDPRRADGTRADGTRADRTRAEVATLPEHGEIGPEAVPPAESAEPESDATGPAVAAPAGPEMVGPEMVGPEAVGPEAADCPGAEEPAGLAALSLRYQIAAALALAVVAVASCVHLGMVFLHVAPSNTVTRQHGRAIDEWIYPEFEQNWKLFAPNPLQQDIAVQVRALVRTPDGSGRETGWYDLSALDGLAIDGNPLPSHTQQNELRRAWDFYAGTHDAQNRPAGLRGDLSEQYLRRIGVLRLDREHAGGAGAVVERVQFRSLTTDVPPPAWSGEKVSDRPVVRELPWWAVPASDRADAVTEASAR
ncbi:DUF5819 family protein [Streptomyces sp. NBC_00728]|uniref:DUF5819 family protein n=1 Tax=Streptomyces sp. NBC_00728 TaxID=2903676 RepID=UPI00386CE7D8